MLLSCCRCRACKVVRVRALMRRMLARMPPRYAESGESALEDCEDPGQGISKHPNFLSFVKASRLIAHRDFDGPEPSANQLSQQLEIEIKPITGEIQAIESIRSKYFVHRRRVRKPGGEYRIEKRMK